MTDTMSEQRNARGEWRPQTRIPIPPIIAWPPRPVAVVKWLFGVPGYLLPLNVFWFGLTLVTWFFLTPELATMSSFEPGWLALLLARNAGLVLFVFGGLHLYLYVLKGQGEWLKFTTQPLATNSSRFMFRSQVWDNMSRSLVFAVPVITGFEALTYWGFANGYLGLFEISSPELFWGWFVFLALIGPAIHAGHFYFGHRLLHTRFLYKTVHALDHRNVEVGPWSGLAMHPSNMSSTSRPSSYSGFWPCIQ